MSKDKTLDYIYLARQQIVTGFFWALGVTLGFSFVSVIGIVILSRFKTLPVIGSFVADVVYETQVNLGTRNPTRLPAAK